MSRGVDVHTELTGGLRELRLPAIRQSYEELARQAEREQLTYEQYLLELVHREGDARQEARTTRLLRQSRIPREKNLETFDLKRLPVKASRQIKTLLAGDFLDRRENLLVFGHPGSGKTRPTHYPDRRDLCWRGVCHHRRSPSRPVWANPAASGSGQ
jgi:DNA replication protein DnaC